MQGCRPYRARFGECVVKIGMGGLCVIIVFGLGLRALLSKCIVKIGMGEGGEYCVDTALLCNGLVFGLGVEGAEECRRHDTPA